MKLLKNKISTVAILFISVLVFCSEAIASENATYFDFNLTPAHQLTDKISMQFVTSSKFTIIQWDLKAGSNLPVHAHATEQVTRIQSGNVDVKTGETVYHLHAGDTMIFPANVIHGFTAISDAVMYEQQTPIREDFLQPDFIEKLSAYLKKNQ